MVLPEPATRSEQKNNFIQNLIWVTWIKIQDMWSICGYCKKEVYEDYEHNENKDVRKRKKRKEYNKFKASLNGDASN